MPHCPECDTLTESWQTECHGCQCRLKDIPPPQVLEVDGGEDLRQAFQSWLKKAMEYKERNMPGDAAACLYEALRRSRGLTEEPALEISVREVLAQVLEQQEKHEESAEQYAILADHLDDERKKLECAHKAYNLREKALMATMASEALLYVPVEPSELPHVPLFCEKCHKLLPEAEVYGLRKGSHQSVRCFCGYSGMPVTKHDGAYRRAMREARALEGRKGVLLQIASRKVDGGRTRLTAAVLAVFLGAFGVHKFYLGERAEGVLSLIFCWTALPAIFALFDALGYVAMSEISFNLTYNIEKVLALMPPEPVLKSDHHDDVFSTEITFDPEDFQDELSDPDCLQVPNAPPT